MRERLADIDFVTAGRLLGTGIIVGGIVLAMFDASACDNCFYGGGSHPKLREFLGDSLAYVWSGSIVLIVTELLARLSGDNRDMPINWNIAELVRVLGVAIIVLGTIWAAWTVHALRDTSGFGSGSGLSNGASVRRFLDFELNDYLWHGGLLILLSALAERIGLRADDEQLEDEAALAPPDAAQ